MRGARCEVRASGPRSQRAVKICNAVNGYIEGCLSHGRGCGIASESTVSARSWSRAVVLLQNALSLRGRGYGLWYCFRKGCLCEAVVAAVYLVVLGYARCEVRGAGQRPALPEGSRYLQRC